MKVRFKGPIPVFLYLYSNILKVSKIWSKILCIKGGFFSESAIRFSNLQISKKKNIPKKLSWTWNLNFPPKTLYCYWRVIWNIFFGDLEIWKTNLTFWKKATFSNIQPEDTVVLEFLLLTWNSTSAIVTRYKIPIHLT